MNHGWKEAFLYSSIETGLFSLPDVSVECLLFPNRTKKRRRKKTIWDIVIVGRACMAKALFMPPGFSPEPLHRLYKKCGKKLMEQLMYEMREIGWYDVWEMKWPVKKEIIITIIEKEVKKVSNGLFVIGMYLTLPTVDLDFK